MANDAEFFEETGHLNDTGVCLFVDALKLKATQTLPRNVADHVEECQTCRRSIADLFALVAGEDYSDVGTHPTLGKVRNDAPARGGWIYKAAALLAGLLGVGILAYYIARDSSPQGTADRTAGVAALDTTAQQGTAAVEKSPDTSTYAASFTADPELEALAGDATRSEEIEVVAPANGARVDPLVRFSWRSTGGGTHTLSVMNNSGAQVVRRAVTGSSYSLPRPLSPGLYYWKLEDSMDLLYVGKFLVGRQE